MGLSRHPPLGWLRGPGEPEPEFCSLEWNMLVNRARALLEALADHEEPDPAEDFQALYRKTECRLVAMIQQAPRYERHQLRRTVDSLHQRYRRIQRVHQPEVSHE